MGAAHLFIVHRMKTAGTFLAVAVVLASGLLASGCGGGGTTTLPQRNPTFKRSSRRPALTVLAQLARKIACVASNSRCATRTHREETRRAARLRVRPLRHRQGARHAPAPATSPSAL